MTERTIFECPAGKAWETDGELFRTYTIDDDAIFWSLVRAYDALQSRIAELEGEVAKLKKGINYWSYCTRTGMDKWCPELREELREFHHSCGVNP